LREASNPLVGRPLRLANCVRSAPPRRRFAPSGRSSGARLPDVASLRQGGVPEHASPTSLRSVREEFRSTPPRPRGARSRRSFGVPEFRIARSHARDLGNSSPRRCRGEVSPRAARRRRGPTPTGCVRERCARRAIRSSDLPSVSLASPASHLPDVASLRQGGVPEHASPTSRRSVEEEFRSSGTRELDVERSGTPPHGAGVGLVDCERSEQDGRDRLRRVAAASRRAQRRAGSRLEIAEIPEVDPLRSSPFDLSRTAASRGPRSRRRGRPPSIRTRVARRTRDPAPPRRRPRRSAR